jgi:hydroxyacylglutathione hydrolase
MILESLTVGPLQCNCYILGCEETREGIVIDPGDDADSILRLIQKHQLNIKYIFSTHAHIDHVGDLEALKSETGADAVLHEKDLSLYENLPMQAAWLGISVPTMAHIDSTIADQDILSFGNCQGEVLHTPGHTPGSVCLLVPSAGNFLFAGDTLFQGSIGRTDLWGGSYEAIMRSIRQKLLKLDDRTLVYPGHGPATTIAEEKQHNPFLLTL